MTFNLYILEDFTFNNRYLNKKCLSADTKIPKIVLSRGKPWEWKTRMQSPLFWAHVNHTVKLPCKYWNKHVVEQERVHRKYGAFCRSRASKLSLLTKRVFWSQLSNWLCYCSMQTPINNITQEGHSYDLVNLCLQNWGWEVVCLSGHTLLTLSFLLLFYFSFYKFLLEYSCFIIFLASAVTARWISYIHTNIPSVFEFPSHLG